MAEEGQARGGVIESREWYIAAYAPDGVLTSDHLKLRTTTLSLDEIPDHHLALEMLYVSIDPYLRTKMTGIDEGLYMPHFNLNEGLKAYNIAKVIKSRDNNYKEGDIVVHPILPVAEYCVVPSDSLMRKIDPPAGIQIPEYLCFLGLPGMTAWVGIELIGEAKAGSNVFITAAAGGVGMFAGQLAKLQGCRVVGSTGSDEKVKLLKDEFGYDDAFNYHKETDFDAALSKYFPDGIDLYLDNVGGKMLEAVLNHINSGARIPLCGMISQYNKIWTERDGVRNMLNLVGKQARMEGFLVGSYFNRFPEFEKKMAGYVIHGKIKSKKKIVHGIENFLESMRSIFTSDNNGKVILQLK